MPDTEHRYIWDGTRFVENPHYVKPCPFNGAEEIAWQYDDTAGKHHWFGTMTGHHVY